MVWQGTVKGKYISIKSVSYEDAPFIVDIRNNEEKNKFLHAVSKDIDAQKEWIRKQIDRKGDYYFIIFDENGQRVALASIYDIDEVTGEAEFGRWVSNGNAFQNIETIILIYDLAFEELGVKTIYTRTKVENTQVVNLWKRFGGNRIGEVFENELWVDKNIITKEDYQEKLRKKNARLLRY